MSSRRNTIQDAVYEELRTNILKLTLKPGTAMSTQDVATRLNVSRTPVREAFIRLQREGLVVARPQRETTVSKIDLRRVEQERFIRESMELGVVELFLQRCSKQDMNWLAERIGEQKRLRDAGDYWGFLQSDENMHGHLFQVAGMELAWNTIMSTNGHYTRIRMLTVQNPETVNSTISQHEAWLSYLRTDNMEAARKELTDHVRKINYEKIELVEKYGDYFTDTEEDDHVFNKIGTLN